MKQVIVSFPASSNLRRNHVIELVNNALESIKKDVIGWNGFVDLRETGTGSYSLIAKCDNEELRQQMQNLLNEATVLLHAA